MKILDESKRNLLELKARVDSLDVFREKLAAIGASNVAAFRQIDIYFEVPKGRLKLRETEGNTKAELIYYERADIPGPKRSKVLILELQERESVKTFLEKALTKKVVVAKRREIYQFKATQIHLDTVENLGTFVEFERKTDDLPDSARKDRETLESLMETLGINERDLATGSYSDLALLPI